MANLLSSLSSLSSGLRAFEQALGASQNNVGNASTAGYARQTATMTALPFDVSGGLIGGVATGEIKNARDKFAELAVQRQASSLGQFQESAALLLSLNQILDLSGDSGIPGGFNKLLQSFSAWSVAPQSATARQQVVEQAEQFASAVRSTSNQLQNVAADSEQRLRTSTSRINALGQKIAAINRQRTKSTAADPGLDTELYNALDELAGLVDFTVLPGENGEVTVLLGGQTPLALSDQAFEIRGELVAPPGGQAGGVQEWRFLDSSGKDITSQFSSGSVCALLNLRNNTLPGLIGGQGQTGSLNEFVTAVAQRINSLLTGGLVNVEDPPVGGVNLFDFGSPDPAQAASTFQLNQTLTASQLAASLAPVQAGPPLVSNGVALELAGLQQSNSAANKINGLGFLAYFGSIATTIGSSAQAATDAKDRAQTLLTQAKAVRQDISGVSLDEEAARIVELQRGYQAISRVVSVIDQMTDSLMSMIR